jgi:hypothetical protein
MSQSQSDLSPSNASRRSSTIRTPLSPSFPTFSSSSYAAAPPIPKRPQSQFIQSSYSIEVGAASNGDAQQAHEAPITYVGMPVPQPYIPLTSYSGPNVNSTTILPTRPPSSPSYAHKGLSGTPLSLQPVEEAPEQPVDNPYGRKQGYPQVLPMAPPAPFHGPPPAVPVTFVESPFL